MDGLRPSLQRLRLAVEDAPAAEQAGLIDETRLASDLAAVLDAPCVAGSTRYASGTALRPFVLPAAVMLSALQLIASSLHCQRD